MLFSFFLFSSVSAAFVRMNNGFATRSVLKGTTDVTVTPSVSNKSSPSLYDLTSHMLDVALLTYTYASLRVYAANDKVTYKRAEEILNDKPVTANDIYSFVKDNIDELEKEKDMSDFELKQLQTLLDIGTLKGYENLEYDEVVQFNDKDKKQIIYGIVLSKDSKLIILSFRGSVTIYDWITNLQADGVKVANPLYRETENQHPDIQIHQGFYDALFKEENGGKTKFQEITDELVQLLNDNPGYRLLITGHSLGASLASLFTFFASTSQYLGKFSPFPLTCVSIASPFVGDAEWRNAFMLQEKTGRIRYLRVTNYADAVPKVPFVSLNIPAFLFKHVGVHLQLYDDKPPRFSYDVDGKSPLIDDKENIVVPISPEEVLHFHSCETYDNRLDKAKPKLQSMHLEDIYANEAFVGDYSNV